MSLPVAWWDFQFGIEAANPVFYLNAAGLVLSAGLARRFAALRRDSPLAAATFWSLVVLAVGTGLHFLGDLTNFPEDGDHVFIHGIVAAALLVFWLRGRRAK